MKSFTVALTVISLSLSGLPVYAGPQGKAGKGQGPKPPGHKCDPKLVNEIYDNASGDKRYEDLVDAIENRFRDGNRGIRSDRAFCKWLEDSFNGRTEVAWDPNCRDCDQDVIAPGTDETRGIDRRDFRPRTIERVVVRERDPAPADSGGGGLFGGNMGPMLMGGVMGFGLAMMLNGRNQQQQMYPMMGQFPPGMMPMPRPMMPGMMPMPGGGPQIAPWLGGAMYGQPGFGNMAPYLGQQQMAPWPGGNMMTSYNPYMYGGYNGGAFGGVPGVGYARPAPSILPMTGYSPYSVTGTIPSNHWGLINAGR